MARIAKPWYWKARKTWCFCHKGERILLGPDHDESLQQYHKIMAEPEQKRQPVKWGAVATILDDFLTWTEENRARRPIPAISTSFNHSSATTEEWRLGN